LHVLDALKGFSYPASAGRFSRSNVPD